MGAARTLDDMSAVRVIGINETSARKGQLYITVMHDLQNKRLLFACEGKDHQTVVKFAQDLQAHGGKPEQIAHVCQDMSAAYAKGVAQALPQAQISYDRFHVVAMANEAMDEVRRYETSAIKHNDETKAKSELKVWLSWATRCRLGPFKKLADTLKQRLDGVVRGMLDNRSNAYVEAMNGLLQQAKRAARGFRTATNFIAIAYLRMSKLKHLPSQPMERALPKYNVLTHRCL